MMRIEETRMLADGNKEIVTKYEISERHTKKAGRIYIDLCKSVRKSGLKGGVRVTIDGKPVDVLYVDEDGRLIWQKPQRPPFGLTCQGKEKEMNRMKRIKIELSNDFHNTEVVIHPYVDENGRGEISESLRRKAKNALCPYWKNCECSNGLGCRGKQPKNDYMIYADYADGREVYKIKRKEYFTDIFGNRVSSDFFE